MLQHSVSEEKTIRKDNEKTQLLQRQQQPSLNPKLVVIDYMDPFVPFHMQSYTKFTSLSRDSKFSITTECSMYYGYCSKQALFLVFHIHKVHILCKINIPKILRLTFII
jgi:hypothetical protein